MRYKTILVHAALDDDAAGRIRYAASLARACDAHLIGNAPTGVSRFLPPELVDAAIAARCAQLRAQARRALAQFDAIAREQDILSAEAAFSDDQAEAALALHARYCDLLVCSQGRADLVDPLLPADLAASLALSCPCPVLALPAGGWPRGPGGDALVAWDGGIAATRAVTAALPLLRGARRVTVLGIGPLPGPGEEVPVLALERWLRRHGVDAHARQERARADVGAALLDAAAACRATLLVMGAFGHARLRETVLGGATATVLARMTLPVLLAH